MRAAVICILIIMTMGGCAHLRGPVDQAGLTPGTPAPDVILEDLRRNSEALSSLKLTGNIRLRLPGEAATQNFRGGVMQYQYPDQFYMRGRKGGFRVYAYVAGEQFLLDLPSENTFYTGREGERFDEMVLDVTPAQFLKEVFLLELPLSTSVNDATVEAYDPVAGTAVLLLTMGRRAKKTTQRIKVEQVGGWRITALMVLNARDEVLIETTCSDYRVYDEIAIPWHVEVEFKDRDALIGYDATRLEHRLRTEPPLDIITIEEARAKLLAAGTQEVRGESRPEIEP